MKLSSLTKPVYLVRRLAYKFYELRHPDEPWIAQGAVRYLERSLTKEQVGWEWGSGRSTSWFAKHLKRLTSIEHDELWFHKVRQKLAEADVRNVSYRHIPLDHPVEEPTYAEYEKLPAYVAVAQELDDGQIDFALIDGHYRMACVPAIVPKIKPGGLLTIDNSNWLASLSEWSVPVDWPVVHQSTNVMTQTTIWRRPIEKNN